jgi:hypothetical protein
MFAGTRRAARFLTREQGGKIWQTRNQEILTNSKIKVTRKPRARQPALRVNRDRARVSKATVAIKKLNRPDRAAVSRALDSVNLARARAKTRRVAAATRAPGKVAKQKKMISSGLWF